MRKFTYINRLNEMLTEPRFINARSFVGESAVAWLPYRDVENIRDSGGVIDRSGKFTVIPNMRDYPPLSEGIVQTSVRVGEKRVLGFASVDGRFATTADNGLFDASDFYQGRAIASQLIPGKTGSYRADYRLVLIDTTGSVLKQLAREGEFDRNWSDGLLLVRDLSGQFPPCYFNNDLEIVVEGPKEKICAPFRDGLARCGTLGKEGYINKAGAYVLPEIFQYASDFQDGIAVVKDCNDKKWKAIDKRGRTLFLLPEGTTRSYGFDQGLAAFKCGGEEIVNRLGHKVIRGARFGYIDTAGKVVIEPRFYSANSFDEEGLACVSVLLDGKERYGFINRDGAFVIEPVYRWARSFSSGFAVVTVNPPHFNKADWIEWQNSEEMPARSDLLEKFFEDYKAFGMTRREVQDILGKGHPPGLDELPEPDHSIESYCLAQIPCGTVMPFFDILYDKDDVFVGWRISSMNRHPEFERSRRFTLLDPSADEDY